MTRNEELLLGGAALALLFLKSSSPTAAAPAAASGPGSSSTGPTQAAPILKSRWPAGFAAYLAADQASASPWSTGINFNSTGQILNPPGTIVTTSTGLAAVFASEALWSLNPPAGSLTKFHAIFLGNAAWNCGWTGVPTMLGTGMLSAAQANYVTQLLTAGWDLNGVDLNTYMGWTGMTQNQALGHTSPPPALETASDLVALMAGDFLTITANHG